jgi:hypothetical protein
LIKNMKTVYVNWDGFSHPVSVPESFNCHQVLASNEVKAITGHPDNAVPSVNGIANYNGAVPNGTTIYLSAQAAQKAA